MEKPSHIWIIPLYKTTGTDRTTDIQNLLRNSAAWSPWLPWWASLPGRLPAAVVLVRSCYTAALPVVLTRVCRATSHELPLLDFAARPGE